MTGPGDIIRRASARRGAPPQNNHMPVPAPAPMAPVPAADGRKTQVSEWRTPPLMPTALSTKTETSGEHPENDHMPRSQTFRAVPQNIGGHAVYREIMRSHDRMGTRHIGKGG